MFHFLMGNLREEEIRRRPSPWNVFIVVSIPCSLERKRIEALLHGYVAIWHTFFFFFWSSHRTRRRRETEKRLSLRKWPLQCHNNSIIRLPSSYSLIPRLTHAHTHTHTPSSSPIREPQKPLRKRPQITEAFSINNPLPFVKNRDFK